MFPKKKLAQKILAACSQFDIDTVVISPGSRNAPLTIGFSNHPEITAYSVVDERSAAFFALGIAQQKQQPVALLCTSGSAVLNYYPAVAEAFYSNIPLVVISADRPQHLIDIGDGQTIRQEHVFANHILYSANLVDHDDSSDFNSNALAEALSTARNVKGPVHINAPFDEPLYETVPNLEKFTFPEIKVTPFSKKSIDFNALASIWNKSERKMILVGVNYPDEKLQHLIQFFADDPSVLLCTETTSNLHHDKAVNSIDQLIFSLEDEDFKALQPDVLLTFGGMIVSKRIKKFLRNYAPKHHWHIDPKNAMNTFFCLSEFIPATPVEFLTEFKRKIQYKSSLYEQQWLALRNHRRKMHKEYLANLRHSDFKVFDQVLQSIPKKTQLQVSNSAIIRYVQLFTLDQSILTFCNRGTSGIDGSTSTAIGAALASHLPTIFITGDLSFFYDSNGLWNANIPKNFKIILINNNGGGIFKIIPGPSQTNAMSYFETSHGLTAVHLAKMYGFEYTSANSTESLKEALLTFYEASEQPKILEIFTPSDTNDQQLKAYFKFIH